MGEATIANENERKYLLTRRDLERVPQELLDAPERDVSQYYLNGPRDSHELRNRVTVSSNGAQHVSTVKKGSPPTRPEVETPTTESTFNLWYPERQTEIVRKKRQLLEFAAGHWALDTFTELGITLLEAEGDVPLPDFGRDVTDDKRFKNYELAKVTDVTHGRMPRAWQAEREPSDIDELRARIEHARQRLNRLIVVHVSGPSGSGKTTITNRLAKTYGARALVINQDHYYHGITRMRELYGPDYQVNFDAPGAIDLELLKRQLTYLRDGKTILRPTYSMATSEPDGTPELIQPDSLIAIFVEGIHALDPTLEGQYDFGVYVDAPLATRVGRRLERDVVEGRSLLPEDNLRYMMEVAEPTYLPHAKIQQAQADQIFYT